MNGLDGIDVLVLAGGLGMRLRSVFPDRPKALAPIAGRPFVDHMISGLAEAGAGRVVLSLGWKAEMVTAHIESVVRPIDVAMVVEPEPLGTGGAVRFAIPHLKGEPVLIVNGDTWLDADFGAFLAAHRACGEPISILCASVDDVSRYGRVDINDRGEVVGFFEKAPGFSGPGAVYGGASLFSRDGLDALARSEGASLERDFFERLPAGAIHGHVSDDARFVDIGTPEGHAAAQGVFLGSSRRYKRAR